MVSDYYALEEGFIDDGNVIGFAKCIGTVALHQAVFTTSPLAIGSGIWVGTSATSGIGIGVALKAGATRDNIPVCLYGIVKAKAIGAIAEGDVVQSDTIQTLVIALDTLSATDATIFRGLNNTGLKQRLGYALQGGASGSEILILVGRVS